MKKLPKFEGQELSLFRLLLKVGFYFILCVMGFSVSAQDIKTQIANTAINKTVYIDGREWYVVKKTKEGGVNYAFLISKEYLSPNITFNSSGSNNYAGSNLQSVATSIYVTNLPTIRSMAVVPNLGNHALKTAVSAPTSVMAKTANITKDILFAPSYKDAVDWNGGKDLPLTSPLSDYTYRWWTRTAGSTNLVYEVQDVGKSIIQVSTLAMYINFVGGVWVNYSPTQYTVTYNGNGHTGGSVPTGNTYNENANVTVQVPGTMTKTNYTFKGWALSSSTAAPTYVYNGTTLSPSSFTITGNVTLYAVWEKINSGIDNVFTQVLACSPASEIDILALQRYSCNRNDITISMIHQPANADNISALNQNKNIPYVLNHSFTGMDSMQFSVFCSGALLDTVQLYINVRECPDNFIDVDCAGEAESTPWSIMLRSKTRPGTGTNYADYINEMDVPLVGDINGDGNIKILAAVSRDPGGTAVDWISEGIAIFDGKTGNYERTIPVAPFHTGSGSRAIFKDDQGKSKIIIATVGAGNSDNDLVCYDLKTGAFIWRANSQYNTGGLTSGGNGKVAANILIADVNNDGISEVIAGKKVFNANTGHIILDMGEPPYGNMNFGYGAGHMFWKTGYESLPYFPALADMDNDGTLEFVAGDQIYKLHIPAGAIDKTGSSVKLLRQAVGGSGHDGTTAIADLNGDGYFDVIVTYNSGTSSSDGFPMLYAYDGKTGQMFGPHIQINDGFDVTRYGQGPSIPFVGDIDGDGVPEICVSSSKALHAFRFNALTQKIERLASMPTTDLSGATALTVFDFNQDGKMELVYRDEEALHIIGFENDDFVIRTTLSGCYSLTQNEYPVIADVTGDGRANIIVFGSDNKNPDATFGKGYVHIYQSLPDKKWAPARHVWNQWAYNAINVNNDLTIPRFQLNPGTAFTGGSQGAGIAFNAFLQQQTLYNLNGNPVWTLPNAKWVEGPQMVYKDDSIVVSGKISNIGTAGFISPIYVTLYKNYATSGNIIKSDSIVTDLKAGETLAVSFTVKNIDFTGIANIIIGINDKNGVYPIQQECDEDERESVELLMANNDIFSTFKDEPVTFDPLDNDHFWSCLRNQIGFIIVKGSTYGQAFFNIDGTMTYTPNTGFTGVDTVTYSITCNAHTDTAKIHIAVTERPDNIRDADCTAPPSSTTWDTREILFDKGHLIHNYGPLLTGDIDNDGIVEIIGLMPNISNMGNSFPSTGIRIFYVENNQVKHKKDILFVGHLSDAFGSMAMARYSGVGYIVVSGQDGYLYAYDAETDTKLWRSSQSLSSTIVPGSMVNIADFNGDGIPEVYSGNRIYSLATGEMICEGGASNNHGILKSNAGFSSMAADIDGDGHLELCAGTQIYRVTIPQGATGANSGNMAVISDMQLTDIPAGASVDGATTVVDIDNDGRLEVIVSTIESGNAVVYVWKPLPGHASRLLGSFTVPATNVSYYSIPTIGNIDNDPFPEIVFNTNGVINSYAFDNMYALKYNPLAALGDRLELKWMLPHTDESGCTGISLFDFNLDGVHEIVYRDMNTLRIINGNGTTPTELKSVPNVISGTSRELPIIADVDGDGQAEIIIQGFDNVSNTVGGITAGNQNGYLRVFKSNGSKWAPARKVWNQYNYNAVNINEDLRVPRQQMNPAMRFPGLDGLMGTSDDVRPFNGFMMQQSIINKNGISLWPAPNAVLDPSLSGYTVTGNAIQISAGITNKGDVTFGSPVYVTVYKNAIASGNIVTTVNANIHINPGKTDTVIVDIPDMTLLEPFINLIIRVNDDGKVFPVLSECNTSDNTLTYINPSLSSLMKKDAVLDMSPPVPPNNGTYPNPVAVLYKEEIEYTISGVNVNLSAGTVIIRDTLPPYLNYVPTSATTGGGSFLTDTTSGLIARETLTWTIPGVASMAPVTVSFKATPAEGVCASQPMFINTAWINASDTLHIATANSTYHQGAGVSVVTFSQSIGGAIINGRPQAIDYKTSPRQGVIVVPDEGYLFAGWSHDAYRSLRGMKIEAGSDIMSYDTLTVFGDVNLKANFTPEPYPIKYFLNAGIFINGCASSVRTYANDNVSKGESYANGCTSNSCAFNGHPAAGVSNPDTFNIESATFTLQIPEKANDEFIGWTGSNGDTPQMTVTIPKGSTGERTYYANFLYSSREQDMAAESLDTDKIWAYNDKLYIYTSHAGAMIRIYPPDGVLQKTQIQVTAGESKITLPQGLYIVVLNNNPGKKIQIK